MSTEEARAKAVKDKVIEEVAKAAGLVEAKVTEEVAKATGLNDMRREIEELGDQVGRLTKRAEQLENTMRT
jgi:polyhydroxyalkanoate synthesis regulator phasin